jgi:hypothetical protein
MLIKNTQKYNEFAGAISPGFSAWGPMTQARKLVSLMQLNNELPALETFLKHEPDYVKNLAAAHPSAAFVVLSSNLGFKLDNQSAPEILYQHRYKILEIAKGKLDVGGQNQESILQQYIKSLNAILSCTGRNIDQLLGAVDNWLTTYRYVLLLDSSIQVIRITRHFDLHIRLKS